MSIREGEKIFQAFLRNYSHRLPSLQFQHERFASVKIAVNLNEPIDSLTSQLVLFNSAVDKGWMQNVYTVEVHFSGISQPDRDQVSIELAKAIGKTPHSTHIKIVTDSMLDVAALTAMCGACNRNLRIIEVVGPLRGGVEDLRLWARALRNCNSLSKFSYKIQDENVGFPRVPVPNGLQIIRASKWERVLRALCAMPKLRNACLWSDEIDATVTVETTKKLVDMIKRNGRRYYTPGIDLGRLQLQFTDMDDAIDYCGFAAQGTRAFLRDLKVNVTANEPPSALVRGLVGTPKFSILLEQGYGLQNEDPNEICVRISNHLMDPTRFRSSLVAWFNAQPPHRRLFDVAVGTVNVSDDDMKNLYLSARMCRDGLLNFDPDDAKNTEWTLIMAALGNLTLGIDFTGRVEYDLDPLYNLVRRHLDKTVGMMIGKPEEDTEKTNSLLKAENTALRKSNVALVAENSSLRSEVQQLRPMKKKRGSTTRRASKSADSVIKPPKKLRSGRLY